MPAEIYPLQILLVALSGLVNRHQADLTGSSGLSPSHISSTGEVSRSPSRSRRKVGSAIEIDPRPFVFIMLV
jgi:hypothetical protein